MKTDKTSKVSRSELIVLRTTTGCTQLLSLLTYFILLSLSIPPENLRKPVFLLFSGGIERDQWREMD